MIFWGWRCKSLFCELKDVAERALPHNLVLDEPYGRAMKKA